MQSLKLQLAAGLVQGTALLLLHWPDTAAAAAAAAGVEDLGSLKLGMARVWKQQLLALGEDEDLGLAKLAAAEQEVQQQVAAMRAVCGL
jgi:hypothetical protein